MAILRYFSLLKQRRMKPDAISNFLSF